MRIRLGELELQRRKQRSRVIESVGNRQVWTERLEARQVKWTRCTNSQVGARMERPHIESGHTSAPGYADGGVPFRSTPWPQACFDPESSRRRVVDFEYGCVMANAAAALSDLQDGERRFPAWWHSDVLRRVLTNFANEFRARGVLDEKKSSIDATVHSEISLFTRFSSLHA
jgi:hypothetical protein